MKLFEILKQQGLFSSDLKARFKNKQITINGEVASIDVDLDIETIEDVSGAVKVDVINSGVFIFNLLKTNSNFSHQMIIFGFENLFNSNIKNSLTDILDQFILIKISRNDSFLLKICQEEKQIENMQLD